MKLLVVLVIGLIVLGAFVNMYVKEDIEEESKQYQGPVPEGYDEQHFRLTGETKLIGVKE